MEQRRLNGELELGEINRLRNKMNHQMNEHEKSPKSKISLKENLKIEI